MRAIGETETGEIIYNELYCDVCENMSGPRTRFDDCLSCGATRVERLKESHGQLTLMVLNNLKREMEFQADQYRKKFSELTIKLEVNIEIS